jgi:hypothetical protein
LSPDPELVAAASYQVVRSVLDAKQRWVDGTPENTFHAFGLATMFPGAKFVHLLRSPVKIAKSLMGFSRAGEAGRDHQEAEAFEKWTKYVSHARLVERALGKERVYRINYEDMIAEPKAQIAMLLEWLGEPFEEPVLQPLAQKINSSKADVELEGNSDAQRTASELFKNLAENPVGESNDESLSELAIIYQRYCNDLNGLSHDNVEVKAKGLIKTIACR